MFDEQEARRLMRARNEVPGPPVRTTLTDVLQRGRRRLRLRRLGTYGGAVAAVAAIAVGAAVVPGMASQDPVGPAATRTPPTTKRPTTAQMPPSTSAPGACKGQPADLPAPTGTIKPENEVVPAFEAAVTELVKPASVRLMVAPQWESTSPKTGTARGTASLDVTDASGTRGVALEVVPFGGTTVQNAEADLHVYGQCDQPFRSVRKNGTIVLLYPAYGGPNQGLQRHLRIYTPGGHLYVVTAQDWGSPNLKQIEGDPDGRHVEGGTGTLPLNDEQFQRLADVFAELG